MKTKNKPGRLKLYIFDEVINIIKLVGHFSIVILVIELLDGFPEATYDTVKVEKLIYLIIFSYSIIVIAPYLKRKLNK